MLQRIQFDSFVFEYFSLSNLLVNDQIEQYDHNSRGHVDQIIKLLEGHHQKPEYCIFAVNVNDAHVNVCIKCWIGRVGLGAYRYHTGQGRYDPQGATYDKQTKHNAFGTFQIHYFVIDHADAKESVESDGGHEQTAERYGGGGDERMKLAQRQIVCFEQSCLHVDCHGHQQWAYVEVVERQDENKKCRRLFVLLFWVDQRHHNVAYEAKHWDGAQKGPQTQMLIKQCRHLSR